MCRGDSATAPACLRRAMAISTVTPLAHHLWGRLYGIAALDAAERNDPPGVIQRRVTWSAADGQEPGPGDGGAPDGAPQVRRPRMDLGIDLGTANTVVSDVRRGIVFDEPSVMLLGPGVGAGRSSKPWGGMRPIWSVVPRPGSPRPTAARRSGDGSGDRPPVPAGGSGAGGRHLWSPVRAVIGVPADSTALETRALLEAAQEAGIRPVTALDNPVAGAVGCGVDPLERRVHMVVDVGGGTAEAVAFCFGGVLAQRTSKVGGDEMTVAVARYLREQHQLHLGELEAERVKVFPPRRDGPLVVHGRDGRSGRARLATVQAAEVADAVRPVVDEVVRALTGASTTFPRRRSRTCWPRGSSCSAAPRWSTASPGTSRATSACRSSSPSSP